MKWSSNIDPQSDGDSETAAWGWDYPTQVLHSPQCCEKILAEPESMTHWCRTHTRAHTHTHTCARARAASQHTHTHTSSTVWVQIWCASHVMMMMMMMMMLKVSHCWWGGGGGNLFMRNVVSVCTQCQCACLPRGFYSCIHVFFLMHFKQWHNLRCINTMCMFIVDYKH